LRAYGEHIACEAPNFFSELKQRNVIGAASSMSAPLNPLVITETFRRREAAQRFTRWPLIDGNRFLDRKPDFWKSGIL
jgi:hypothetical protein